MSDITLTTLGNQLILAAPYHPDMPAAARSIGGRFDRDTRAWKFDIRDQARVEELAARIYGYRGETSGHTCIVRVTLDGYSLPRSVRFAGREICRRENRDDDVRLAEGVVLVGGRFPWSGGSKTRPLVGDCEGVVLEIRDLPVEALEAGSELPFEIIDGDPEAGLREERERLLARLAEIDALLGVAA